jgi:hypothetical protein
MGSFIKKENGKLGIVGGIAYYKKMNKGRKIADDMRVKQYKEDPHKLIRRAKWVAPYGL